MPACVAERYASRQGLPHGGGRGHAQVCEFASSYIKSDQFWPMALDQPLPKIPVPLLPGDADLALDLQACFTAIYSLFHYDDGIDYAVDPPGPLTELQRAWLDARLRAAGRRE